MLVYIVKMLEGGKVNLCKIIKEIYTSKVLSFNSTLEGLKAYNDAYMKIAGLLSSFNPTKEEIYRYLGDEFLDWYFNKYDKVVARFLDD